jgi:predicted MPP superfamily phosphohydrolase
MTKRRMLYFLIVITVGLITALIGIITSYKVRLNVHDVKTELTITIGQISDTHFTERFDASPFEQQQDKLNEQNLDVLFFTGDMFQTDVIPETLEEDVTTFFQSFEADHKYAVLGNHDYSSDEKRSIVIRILEAAGFTILINQDVTLDIHDQQVHLIGLDDLRFGNTNYTTILETTNEYDNNIVLAHQPDTFHLVQEYDVLMMFAGHSHGGQVRLPWIGAVVNVEGAKDYNKRYYNEENTQLFISFGLGESLLPIRMFNPRSFEVYKCS